MALQASPMLKNHKRFASGESTGFVVDNRGSIQDSYSFSRKSLGEGAFAKVFRVVSKSSNDVKAVKQISKASLSKEELQRIGDEVAVMKVIDHPGVLKLYETFEDHDCMYLVLELCNGGELFDRIVEERAFSERKAAVLMEQIFRIGYYLHEKRIAHRDLKPENIMFLSQGPIDETPMKLIDFGMAAAVSADKPLTTRCGTAFYVAPEVIKGKYLETCDDWSCGVIMYVMLCGYPPFNASTDAGVLKKVQQGKYSFASRQWKDVSQEAQSLIRALLTLKPTERCTSRKALGHPWVKLYASKVQPVACADMTRLVQNLQIFQSANKLKRATLHIIAKHADEEKIKSLRDAFVALDTSGDGKISLPELKEGLQSAGLLDSDPSLTEALADIDTDGNGEIDYSEWIAATLESRQYLEEEVCRSAFNIFDENGDGKISREELAKVLSDVSIRAIIGDCPEEAIDAILQDADGDGDGSINFPEFMSMMKRGVAASPKHKRSAVSDPPALLA